jgi:hypothetical protein
MVKHVVMFKMKEFDSEIIKNDLKMRFKSELEAMVPQIPVIRSFEVGINISEAPRAYDLVIISEFDSLEDMDVYNHHPEHMRVLEFAKQVSHKSAVVDFII